MERCVYAYNMSDLRNNGDGGMTREELEQYKKLLSVAYPFEKGKIRDSVMAQIASEPAPKKNKTPWKTIAIRWGSVAAALVFICTVVVSIMPRLGVYVGKDSFAEADEVEMENSAIANPGDAHETAPAEKSDDAYSSADADLPMESPEIYTPVADDSYIYYSEELIYSLTAIADYSEDFEISETPLGDNLAPECSADDSLSPEGEAEEAVPESVATAEYVMTRLMTFSSPSSISTVTECAHSETFMNSYHEIPAIFVNLVGADEYAAWESEISDDSCKNIVGFIERFDVSSELFTELVETTDLYYTGDYPIELIYSGDADAIEKYYSAGGDLDGCLTRYFEYKFKTALGESVENYNAWRSMTGFGSVAEWSIAQLVRDLDVEREDLEAVYNSTVDSFLEVYEGAKIPTYDLDAIVECGHEIRRAITGGALGHEVDALYRK